MHLLDMNQTVKMYRATMTSANERNKVYKFLYGLSKVIYVLGGPNFWPEQLNIPNFIHKIHHPVSIFIHIIRITITALEWGALFTQIDLSEKQKCDLIIMPVSHTVLYSYILNAEYYAETVKEVFKNLAIDSKSFDDKEIERDTIKRIRYFCGFCISLFFSTMIMYGIDAYVRVLKYEDTFTTIITAWPAVNDHSKAANVVRIVAYIIWWIVALRETAVSYFLVTPVTICLSHQFKNLKGYFYSLNDIFDGNEDQKEKEQLYEQGFKIGIRWHADILKCTKLAQKVLAVIFGGQIILHITAFSMFLLRFVNEERTLANTITIIASSGAVLFSTGCLMWNAGDVTVEAFSLSTAIFESGWHNCTTGTLLRVRSMITIAMWQSQRPVQLHCLGVVQMSYQSYLTIVKSSYSVFSVLY